MNKLDLNKLEEKLDSALKNETSESLTNWLKEKRQTIDDEQSEIELVYDGSTTLGTIQVIAYWQPTSVLRWKRINIDKLSYNKVLQQMWQSSKGKQEWRDVPEED